MSTQILIKRSTTTGAIPTTSDIAVGELAVNTTDKRIFTNNSGTIVELGTTPTTQAVTGNASVGGTFDVVGAVTVGNFTADGTVDLTSATVTIPAPTADTHPATKKYVDDEVNAILAGAPAALDTLNEIAAAINDDANVYTTLTNSIATKLSLSGGTMTGSIDMGANSITTSADPATANTLTRKSYVDGLYQSTVDAEVSAAAALASEQAAATSASNAATSASASATSATASASSATNAASSATAAASSATSSANSATASATSATQSAASATQAQALVDSIESFYLGAEASAPTVDDNGDPLQAGDWYFNTTDSSTYIYNGSSWQSVSPDLVSDLTPQLGGNLDTNGNDINFGDNDKAIFGAGSDLQIYHDTLNSVIADSGTGNLVIAADDFRLTNSTQTANMIKADEGGAVTLTHNGGNKLATTSTGIDVTGTATMDGLTVDNNDVFGGITLNGANAPALKLNDTTDNAYCRIATNNGGRLLLQADAGNIAAGSAIELEVDGKEFLKVDSTGDISFYEDTGTTAKFFWDASAESLGIGTSSPSVNLDIRDESTSGIAQIGIRGGASGAGVLRLSGGGTTYGASSFDLFQNGAGGYVWAQSSLPIVFGTNSTERMRIDSSGNLLVGDTTTTPYADSSGTGMAYRDDYGIFSVKSAGIQASIFNRTGSDGAITEFRKDGTTVGSIGTSSGNTFIGTGDTALLFDDANNRITPWNTNNTVRDGQHDLGYASGRFKDLYLSGGVYLGGTGGANHLDDYEEGTFTPVFTGAGGAALTATYRSALGTYVKVGNVVTVSMVVAMGSLSGGSANLGVGGLPFTQQSSNANYGASTGLFRYLDIPTNSYPVLELVPSQTYGNILFVVDGTTTTNASTSSITNTGIFDCNIRFSYVAA